MANRFLQLVVVACVGLGLSACSTARRPATVESVLRSVEGYDDEELWLCGRAAKQAEDHLRAAVCFSLLADRSPIGPRWREATLEAAAAWERLGDWERALHRYHAAFEPDGPDAVAIIWKLSTAYYELRRYPEAIELLDPLVDRPDLSLEDRIRARSWRAICKVEMGEWDEAETDLRRALGAHARNKNSERVDTYWVAQAQFFLGEIYRLRFEAIPIDQTDDVPKLSETIEEKAGFLLSAQGHYVRTLRLRHPHWVAAAGQRIGELYERFHDELIAAPIPSDLTPEQVELYRTELRRKVRILVKKAIVAYEQTLSVAERLGLEGDFVDKTRAGLARMEKILLESEDEEEPPTNQGEAARGDEPERGTTL